MCGIFGIISDKSFKNQDLKKIVSHSTQRGKDSSGLIYLDYNKYQIIRADFEINKLLKKTNPYSSKVVFGHSRLITNGLSDNQPVVKGNIFAIHNGIIINDEEIWKSLSIKRQLQIDSEAIIGLAEEHLNNNLPLEDLPNVILSKCKGIISCALLLQDLGKIILFSNNGSLHIAKKNGDTFLLLKIML